MTTTVTVYNSIGTDVTAQTAVQVITLTESATAVIAGVPSGGTTGQRLAKVSNANFDVAWVDDPDTNLEGRVSVVEYDISEIRDTISQLSVDAFNSLASIDGRVSVAEYDLETLRDQIAEVDFLTRQLTSDKGITFVNTSTYHDIFNSAMTVESGTAYAVEMWVRATQGATSTAKALRFDGGTCTFTSGHFFVSGRQTTLNIITGSAGFQSSDVLTGVTVVSNAASADWQFLLNGILVINQGGTFMPKLAYITANPTGTILIKSGTYCRLTKLANMGT